MKRVGYVILLQNCDNYFEFIQKERFCLKQHMPANQKVSVKGHTWKRNSAELFYVLPKKAICKRNDSSVDKCCGGLVTPGCPEAIGGRSARKGKVEETTKPPFTQERKSDFSHIPNKEMPNPVYSQKGK